MLAFNSALTLRELIDHAIDCGLYRKEAQEVDVMISQMINQLDVVEKILEVKNKRGCKSDDQKSLINSILSFIASTPTSGSKIKCSFKQYSDIIPKTSIYRLFREASVKIKNYYYLMIQIQHGSLLRK